MAEGVAQGQWVARLIRDRLATSWPVSVAALAGAWQDMPTAEELRRDTLVTHNTRGLERVPSLTLVDGPERG